MIQNYDSMCHRNHSESHIHMSHMSHMRYASYESYDSIGFIW